MDIYCGDNFECLKNHENRKISFGTKIDRYEPQVNTSSLYKTFNLPERFENTRKYRYCRIRDILIFIRSLPWTDVFRGCGIQRKNVSPFYRTTNLDYGWYSPSPHTVPQRYRIFSIDIDVLTTIQLPHRYFPRTNQFSELMAKCGMYRNHSLNTIMDWIFWICVHRANFKYERF